MLNDPNAAAEKPSLWSQFTLRFVVGLTLMAVALGWIIGFSISHVEPGLLLAVVVAQFGFGLVILEARSFARHDLRR